MMNKDDHLPVGETPWGGDPRKKVDVGPSKCKPFERAYCLELRAENEPETLLTPDPNILRCPACGFEIQLNADGEERAPLEEEDT